MRRLLVFLSIISIARSEQVIVSEVMYNPPPGKPEYIEIQNLTSNRLDMARWRLKDAVDYTFPGFTPGGSAHFLNEYERIVVSSADPAVTRAAYPGIPQSVRVFGPWSPTTALDNAGDQIVLEDAAGARLCALSYGDGGKWPVAADGTGHSIIVVNANRKIDDWRNWKLSPRNGGSPGYSDPAAQEPSQEPYLANPEVSGPGATVINMGDSWKYFVPTSDPGTTWRDLGFAETGWSGPSPALLGYETATLPAPGLQTAFPLPPNPKPITYLFRKTFTFTGNPVGATFVIDQIVDDGAYYYLNGQPLGGLGYTPGGPWNSFANRGVGDAIEEPGAVSGALTNLISGTNVLAVEVHQASDTSSDLVFGARLKIATASSIVINEVKPGTAGNGFVEFYNTTGAPINLQGYYLSDTPGNLAKFQIASSLVVPANGLATIGYAESNLAVTSPVVVYLTQPNGTTVLNAINAAMALDGRSLGRLPVGGASWFTFGLPTQGSPNGASASSFTLRMSEAHFGVSGVDWVEFCNVSTSVSNGSGYFVASKEDFSDKVPVPASVPANGYASVPVNFATDGGGDVVLYLIDASNNVLDAVELSRRAGLNSVQRFPLASNEWFNAATATQDAANSPAIHDEILINEIMHATPSRHEQGQFIELFNRSAGTVDLTGWRLVDGLRFDFAPGTSLAAGAYLVVAKDPAFLTANYPGITGVVGPANGSLRRGGELVRLEDERRNLADSVDYRSGGEWPQESGGNGSSLELINPAMDNSQPSAWRASDESNKASFQLFSHTGTYRELRGIPSGNISDSRELLLNLVSDGHIVMRNISLANVATPGTNLITTGNATSHTGSGANGFLCTGTHCMSDTLADGFHLISTGAGDTKANKAEIDVTALAKDVNYTLSFEARWVSGMPLLVAQTWDRSFGKVFRLPLPNNLGTPGTANSRFNGAPAPTVDSLTHSPKVPTSSQTVVVTARVASASPLTAVTLFHKTDAGGAAETYTPLAMNDTATNGDAVAGDGIWSATIGVKGDSSITQFYVRATATNGQTQDLPRNAPGVTAVNGSVLRVPARPAMYIVDNSPPSTTAGILTERYIISLFDRGSLRTWDGFSATRDWDYPLMSNFGHNSTMIYSESDVIYNCEMRKGGSKYTRDGGDGMTRIRYRPPGDNQWRGRSKSGIDNDATNNTRFHNRTVRYMLYTLGQPIPDSEFCQRIVNNDNPELGDDQEQTDDDFFDRVHPGGQRGELFEIDQASYKYDSNNMEDNLEGTNLPGRWMLNDWDNPLTPTYPSDESPIYFHGNWLLRFPKERYDYAALAQFIKTAYNNNTDINVQIQATQDTWREQMQRMIDVDHSAAYAAARGYAGDGDNFTLIRGKNGFLYRRPTDGKFEFHHWDSDLGFNNEFDVIGTIGGTGWTNLSNAPYWRRSFNFYLAQLQANINGVGSRMDTYLTAMNYQSANPSALAPFKTSGFNYSTWFANRNATITTAINSFGGTNTTRATTVSTPNNQTVGTPLFSISGEAPAHVWAVDVLNHPEGLFKWTPTSTNAGLWTITNLAIRNGANALTVRFLAKDGTVLSTMPFNVTFTGNGPPLPRLTMSPASGNIALNEAITLDGNASSDPENGSLTFAWSVTPVTGAVLTPAGSAATARFTVPGTYTLTMSVTDASSSMASTSRAISVSDADDFVAFSSGALPAGYTVANAEYRDNYSPSTWYSLEDFTGRILIQINEDVARPIAAPTGTFPRITRDLPDSVGFVLQTDFEPLTREFGNWQAGLWLEMSESGTLVRYTFDLDGGLNLRVRRAANPANFAAPLLTVAHTGSGATLRIRRAGNTLFFERKGADGLWASVHSLAVPAGSTANIGGIFTATSVATSVLTAFDYILVSDPTTANNVLTSLRITEIMYSPGQPDNVEYIELRNTGAAAVDLQNCRFANNDPFDEFIFPSLILNPGAYVVVTNSTANFTARYGATAALAGQWGVTSGLNNSGENIRLLDPSLNEIHSFTYSSAAPWPTTTNGSGASIEIINTNGNYDHGTNWRASFEIGGSPGFAGAGPDTDGDGQPDSHEALFGTDPNDASSQFRATAVSNPENNQITFPSVAGRQYRVEYRNSMTGGTWQTLQTITATGASTSINDPTVPKPPLRFYRVSAL